MAQILVVDDEATIRHVLRVTLETEGYDVVEADNGLAAIACVAKHKPDLVIMDIIMPIMEGIEAIFEIRQRYPDVRIVAISGGGQIHAKDILDSTEGLDIMGTMEKPFKPKEILKMVAEVLAQTASDPDY